MKGKKFIQSKQQSWTKRQNLDTFGSVIGSPEKGEKNYLDDIEKNLYGNQLTTINRENFLKGDGGEIKDNKNNEKAKMKALHSSSALAVNIFQNWQNKDAYPIINSCKLCNKHKDYIPTVTQQNQINFEQKFEISTNKALFPRVPNLDIVIDSFDGKDTIAIESKFSEPYGSYDHEIISEHYTNEKSFWKEIPELKKLAIELQTQEQQYKYLDASQLIKHILGLKNKYNNKFKLLYIWYDVLGEDGAEHRKEIEDFSIRAKKDNIAFRHITYQEVIMNLVTNFYEGNEDYCNYLTDRYL